MRLLIAAATTFEIAPFQEFVAQNYQLINENHYCRGNVEIFICITGIGGMQTVFNLMESIVRFYPHFCLQIGVAGAFNRTLALGDLVVVREEIMGDLGVDNHGKFEDMFDIGLMNPQEKPFTGKKLINGLQDFPLKLDMPFVSAVSVNTVSGSEALIEQRRHQYPADIESMEGAAFHYVCMKKKIPFLQMRSISNYVEPRDKSSWKMKEAIHNINEWLIENIPE